MHRKLTALLACGLMATSSLSFTTPARAQVDAVVGAIAAGVAGATVFGGRNYCYYPGGWQGPGWYWCGYAYRSGLGWGGPIGWQGWSRPGYGRPGYGRPGIGRPGIGRPGGGFRPGRPGGGFRPGRPGGGHGGGGHGGGHGGGGHGGGHGGRR